MLWNSLKYVLELNSWLINKCEWDHGSIVGCTDIDLWLLLIVFIFSLILFYQSIAFFQAIKSNLYYY